MGLKMSRDVVAAMKKESTTKDYFRVAGDLDDNKLSSYFKDNMNNYSFSDDDSRKKFLNSIVSEVSYSSCDVIESGKMILSFNDVVGLYEEGANIIKADYLNEFMVDVEYVKIKEKGKGR